MLEAAINGYVEAIVSFNARHLAGAKAFGIEVVTPGILLDRLRADRVPPSP